MTVPIASLAAIRNKVRLLTGSPDVNTLTDVQSDEYTNTFYLYDMPEQLRLFNLKVEYEFYTQPNVDAYFFPSNPPAVAGGPPGYLTVGPPTFIAGYQSFWTQSQDQFFRMYPQLEFIEELGTGDGSAGPYTLAFTNIPMLRGYDSPGTDTILSQVLVTGVDATGGNQVARDNGAGLWIDEAGNPLSGSIDYVTGTGTIQFANAVTGIINGQNIPYVAARPQGILFYNDTFFMRPVPDQAYKVQLDAYRTPTALLAAGENPQLNEWWQYLAFGTAKKVFEDRLDVDGLAKIMPLLDEQQRLILRRTLVQLTNERTATIYTEQVQPAYQSNFNSF